ncbi:MAG: glutamate--cysteine ligase [Alphaproteobacteria bacterium]|nr:glutamate--cysteine ligase [Alphaproteobacteria bacterium]
MSAPPSNRGEPITHKDQLINYFIKACCPKDQWKIGTEHEKFLFNKKDLKPVPYEGDKGIKRILSDLSHLGWDPIYEEGNIIALSRNQASISLEPGGQFELSGAPLHNIHQTYHEIKNHLIETYKICTSINVGMLGMGFLPKWQRQDITWMPKKRYQIMKDYMPTRGHLGHDMMLRTSTVQANLDFSSEKDMIQKMRLGFALQSLVTALFADSPFVEGKNSEYQSYRARVWLDTDPDRCGLLPFVFDQDMSFERYVDYALNVPMYFVYYDNRYINVAGQSFKDFMKGNLPALPGVVPTLSDWSNHLTTLFPDVRLKNIIEMRGADSGSLDMLCALPALWVGLLYDQNTLDEAWDLVRDWTYKEREELRRTVPKYGLKTVFRGQPLNHLAKKIVDLAAQGLSRRSIYNDQHQDESYFLDILKKRIDQDCSPAEEKVKLFNGRWSQNLHKLYEEYSFNF